MTDKHFKFHKII